jgi:hypothetical protein
MSFELEQLREAAQDDRGEGVILEKHSFLILDKP